jgi:RNA polymerase sigma-70 factor (ECF subfamily)
MFALRRLRVLADADDAAQETLCRILVALREGRVLDLEALPGYVFETARHVCAHQARRHQRTERAHAGLTDIVAANSPEPDPLSTLISAERVEAVREALATLPPEDRELLRLTYVEGLTGELIAERLGLSAGNVRVRRHRVQKELARRLRVTESPHRAPAGEAP